MIPFLGRDPWCDEDPVWHQVDGQPTARLLSCIVLDTRPSGSAVGGVAVQRGSALLQPCTASEALPSATMADRRMDIVGSFAILHLSLTEL